jgi:hypothetical protein
MCNNNMVVIYCPRYEIVTTATPSQLEQAGWRTVQPNKVVQLSEWIANKGRERNPVPSH